MALQYRRASYAEALGTLVPVKVPGFRQPILLRAGTSDAQVFLQHIMQDEMAFPVSRTPTHILDGGANVGLASLVLAKRFPEARIAAVEPEQENYRVLCANTQSYPNITPVNAALWRSDQPLYVHQGADGSSWSFRVSTAEKEQHHAIEGITIPTLARRLGWPGFDLVKLDVEGGEKEIFDHGPDTWLDQTSVVAVELHDRFVPGCTEAVLGCLDPTLWVREAHGEYAVFRRPP